MIRGRYSGVSLSAFHFDWRFFSGETGAIEPAVRLFASVCVSCFLFFLVSEFVLLLFFQGDG